MTEKLFDGNMMEKEIEEKKRNLKENYREIRENIAAAAKASGRKPERISLFWRLLKPSRRRLSIMGSAWESTIWEKIRSRSF